MTLLFGVIRTVASARRGEVPGFAFLFAVSGVMITHSRQTFMCCLLGDWC